MLTLKRARLASTMVSTTAARWKNACATMIIAPLHDTSTTACATMTTDASLWKETHLKAHMHRNFINLAPNAPVAVNVTRFYSKEAPSPTPDTPSPSPPKLPDKDQMLKIFFRVLAFVWDISYWLFLWTRKNFKLYVMENPSVQMYLKKLQDKMEAAKKN